jgi:hypothetical protein
MGYPFNRASYPLAMFVLVSGGLTSRKLLVGTKPPDEPTGWAAIQRKGDSPC